jgi:hypothetical protein
MTGKDCRANGDAAAVVLASDRRLLRMQLAHAGRNVLASSPDADIIAVDFDPRRGLMFWVDAQSRRVFRSALPRGNQSHVGQALDIDKEALAGNTPAAIAIDYLTG